MIVAGLKNERACSVPRKSTDIVARRCEQSVPRHCANSVANADCVGPQRLAAVGGCGVVGGRGEGGGSEEEVTYPLFFV